MDEIRIVDGDVDLRGLVRELARVGSDGAHSGEVLTMYVDVDPRTFAAPASRADAISSAIDGAERAAPDRSWSPTIQRLRSTFANGGPADAGGARGLLVYTTADGAPTMVRLPWPVEPEVAFDRGVHVRQLVRSLPTSSWCVLLCNRRNARILLGDRDHLEQVDSLHDDVDGAHAQGGWSQTRFARHTEQQVRDHLRRALEVVEQLRSTGAFDCLLVAAPPEVRSVLRAQIPDQLHRTMCGFLDVDVDHASVAEVAAAAAEDMRAWDDDQLERTLARLQQNASGTRDRAVIGLDDVLQAIAEQRVETLVVNDGFSHPGLACPHGDWLATDGGVCPSHGTRLQPCADIVELAIEHALRQNAHVTIVDRVDESAEPLGDGTRPERMAFQAMRTFGGISAIVRFALGSGRSSSRLLRT